MAIIFRNIKILYAFLPTASSSSSTSACLSLAQSPLCPKLNQYHSLSISAGQERCGQPQQHNDDKIQSHANEII